ncbi:MAG TPA: endopeptidase La [Clostridiales bacterium]|nr:endopeptidase La [Clostridiales bacterium]
MSIDKNQNTTILPALALRGLVLFPGMMLHFDAGRKKSVAALNSAMETDQKIYLISQKDVRIDEPKAEDLYTFGCIAKIRQILRLPGDAVRVLVEGICRASTISMLEEEPYFVAEVAKCAEKKPRQKEVFIQALIRHVRQLFEEYSALSAKIPPDIVMTINSAENPGYLADFIASNLPLPLEDRQNIIEELNPIKRLEYVATLLERECEILNLDAEISEKVRKRIDENQREYYLREQMKVISSELNNESPEDEEEEYNQKIRTLKAPEDVKNKLFKEVEKLYRMPSGSHEATVTRNYLDTCLELPWGKYTKDKINIDAAQKILDKDHYGLTKVKQRILELLAVHSLAGNVSGQIVCLLGPPGVGKTSIARSIAKCMGRKFARISLGGLHDEAEIRGHRKTYIGAMPGRIITAIKQAGSSNPVILLDEIDKLGSDYKGDPSYALLEVLDSEQNSTFRDNYLEVPFDLSKVLFITTANTIETIPAPLRDRMEIITLSSYTREDKFNIAKNHLISKQLKKHGLKASNCKITDDAIYSLIDYYTREAGVRKLEHEIASLCRKAAKQIIAGEKKKVVIEGKDLQELLGPRRYKPEQILVRDEVGVVNGLAWTSVGGELMQLEVAVLEGTGKIEITGSFGDVMKESARTAVSYVRSRAREFGIDPNFYKTKDIHIHATEAAIPKDGPSAGVTITTALISALTQNPVLRDVAMTGEITLLGRVLPIGGLKEKTMAAYRAGIKTVFIPKDNEPDLSEIDPLVKQKVNFIAVDNVSQILKTALVYPVNSKKIQGEIIPPMQNVNNNEVKVISQ